MQQDKVFDGSIPQIYDNYLVPLIFQAYAEDLAVRAAAQNPGDVLETAAGSGVVTRALAPRLPAKAKYVVSDLNPPMLERCRDQQPQDERLSWQVTDALDLPFEAGRFDVVLCQFGVMFFPDKVAGYAEAKRILRPQGCFLFNVWDRIEENVFADHVTQALCQLYPDDPPLFMARTPHGYHDPETIEAELAAVGFADIAIEHVVHESTAASAREVAVAYCQGTPLRNEIVDRDPEGLDRATDHATACLAERYGQGPLSGKIAAFVVTARP